MAIHFNLAELMIASQDSIPRTLMPLHMQLSFNDSDLIEQRLRKLARKSEAADGINFLASYCSMTGAPAGFFTTQQMDMLAHSYLADGARMDDEEMADDLTIRCIAAMRPSPLWVSLTPARLEQLAFIDPVGVAVYLVMRCFESEVRMYRQPNGRNWGEFESMIFIQKRRIQLYRGMSKMRLDTLRDLLLALLQVDARVGLSNLRSPELLKDGTTVANLDWAIRECHRPQSHGSFVKTMIRCYQEQLDSYYQETLKLERQARGNVVTRGMFEYFAREHAPKSPTALVAEVKRKKVKAVDSMITDELGDFDAAALRVGKAMNAAGFDDSPALNKPLKPSFATIGMLGALKIGVK